MKKMLLFGSVALMAIGAQAEGTFKATSNVVSSKKSTRVKKVQKDMSQSTQGSSNTTDDAAKGVSGSTENSFVTGTKAMKKGSKSVYGSTGATSSSTGATSNGVSTSAKKSRSAVKKGAKNIGGSFEGTSNGVSTSAKKTRSAVKKGAKNIGGSFEGTLNVVSSKNSSKDYSYAEQEVIVQQAAVFIANGEEGADFDAFFKAFQAQTTYEWSKAYVAEHIAEALDAAKNYADKI